MYRIPRFYFYGNEFRRGSDAGPQSGPKCCKLYGPKDGSERFQLKSTKQKDTMTAGHAGAGAGAWLTMARVPFHSVGVLPFILGTVVAWRIEHSFRLDVLILGTLAVVAILVSTHFSGECYDHVEDAISSGVRGIGKDGKPGPAKVASAPGAPLLPRPKSRFAGGTGVIAAGTIPRERAGAASRISLAAAAALGLVIYFGLGTGPLTIPLGALGMLCGFFYSTPPLRWVKRGLGELMIGFAYGWLPIAVSYYLMSGKLTPAAVWLGLPVGMTIFNVILINEFPDFEADRAAGKRNLVVRFGKRASAAIYAASAVFFCASFVFSVARLGLPGWILVPATPIMLLALAIAAVLTGGGYKDPKKLEIMCGLTIFANLAVTLVYIVTYWCR